MQIQLHALIAVASAIPALAQVPISAVSTLSAPGAHANDHIGRQFEVGSSWVVAGAPERPGVAPQSGAAILWPRSGTTFGVPIVLSPPTPGSAVISGRFGTAVSVEANEVVVTELRSLHFGAPDRGAVHRFRFAAGVWSLVDSIETALFGSQHGFGSSVAREGDLIAVGAPFDYVGSIRSGTVHLYRYVAGQWQPEAILSASDANNGDQFGMALALDGGRLLVGAEAKRNGSVIEGAAYVFEQSGNGWSEAARFSIDAGSGDHRLGRSVSISGSRVVVGATQTNDPGAAYVFVRSGPAWVRERRLQPAGLGTSAMFGSGVALEGDILVVGAQQDSVVGVYNGSAYLYERTASGWETRARLVPEPSSTGLHGAAVGLDAAGTLLVGALNGHAPGNPIGSGLLRAYRPEPSIGTPYCTPVPNSTLEPGRTRAIGSDLVANDHVTLVAYDLPRNAFGFFLTSRTQGVIQQPGGSQGVLCLGGAIGRYVGPGQVQNAGQASNFTLTIDLTEMPTPTGLVPAQAGETWSFQAWHRDLVTGVVVSNFTDAVAIGFH